MKSIFACWTAIVAAVYCTTADAESFFVKKATWQESMLATRALFERQSLGNVKLSHPRWSAPLPASTLTVEPAGKDPVTLQSRLAQGGELFSRIRPEGIAPPRSEQGIAAGSIRYLYWEIAVPEACKHDLAITTDVEVAVWVNNVRMPEPLPPAVASKPVARKQITLPMELRRGANRVLVKAYGASAGRLSVEVPAARLDVDRVADDLFRRFWEAFPESDWFAQDSPEHVAGESNAWRDLGWYFAPRKTAEAEQAMIRRVLDEVGPSGRRLAEQLEQLARAGVGPADARWLALYVESCQLRRRMRLAAFEGQAARFVFARHAVMGGSHYAYTEGQSDAQAERHFTPGSELCLATLRNGEVQVETLIADRHGVIRDPDVSYDGRRAMFAWKRSDLLDDYHLYELDLASRAVRQLTSGLGVADYEGCYLPDGDILFNSTRCVQTVDCWWTEVSNLYRTNGDGRLMRRLTFDQVHDNYPTVTDDGRILYTRWEYNDRGQIYPQPLLQMNPDGTNQSEFYGVNSWFPTTILHARGIPGTPKVVAIATGHHSRQTGKLIVLDPRRGRQENEGVQLVAPLRDTPAVKVDAYGQDGELFQYPYPLDETHFLVSWHPTGWAWNTGRGPRFGIYWMAEDGRRERLTTDDTLPCGQPVPVSPRHGRARPETVDYSRRDATCYIQDVHAGPGLDGVPRGMVKRVRVVALDFRAAGVGQNGNGGPGGGALISTPVAIGNGTWDPKIVLGDATVHDDGSAIFRVPARTPIYFQLLDENGRMVQSMRSWTSLQPGENGSCVGCHEHKNRTPLAYMPGAQAAHHPIENLRPVVAEPGGFSFRREVQPIIEGKCVSCHNGDPRCPPDLRSQEVVDTSAKRKWTTSYLSLTHAQAGERGGSSRWRGDADHPMVNWISSQSVPTLLPPLSAGSNRSRLIAMLEAGHEKVQLSPRELETLCTWIDLGVPFAGDYREAAEWTAEESAKYERYLAKRQQLAADDSASVAALGAGGQTGKQSADAPSVELSIEVVDRTGKSIAARRGRCTADEAIAVTTPRAPEQGDRIRIAGSQHLAVQFGQGMPEALLYSAQSAFEIPLPAPAAGDSPGPYPPGAFDAPLRIGARPASQAELGSYRNLARNPYDVSAAANHFPHATASSECRGSPVFAARNAIDGWLRNQGHGAWPFQSWGPEKRIDVTWQVDFGREVQVDRVVLHLRADLPHDHQWNAAALEFSDGQRIRLSLARTHEPQAFGFSPRTTQWLRLVEFRASEPLGWCALTEFEAWGRDPIPVVRQSADAH